MAQELLCKQGLQMGVVRLECPECGSAHCGLDGEEIDESWIVCSDCGARLVTFGQLHDEIARQARDYATKSIRMSLGLPTGLQDNDVAGSC